MIDYSEIIQKIKVGDFFFRDKKKNTLLHSLANCEETMHVPIEPVIAILAKCPDMADAKNEFGMTPGDVLDGCQMQAHTSNRPFRRLLHQYMTEKAQKEKLEKGIHMTFIEQLAKDQHRVISGAEADSVLGRPSLLLFSGRGNYALPLINGFGRLIRKTLGINERPVDDFQVISVRYPGTQRDLCNDYLISKQPTEQQLEHPDHPLLYIRSFVERYIRPLYLNPQGRKLPIPVAMKNMRMLNFIGYSYGSSVIQGISDVMRDDMIENGFKKSEIDQIQRQILVLHFGAALNEHHYRSGFTNFHILNTQDDVVGMDMMELLPSWEKEKSLIRVNFKKQKNQIVMLINTLENNTEHAPHHINTYCNEGNMAQKVALAWGKSILFNGLDNSIQNTGKGSFTPLKENLEQMPVRFIKRQGIALKDSPSTAMYRRKLQEAQKVRA